MVDGRLRLGILLGMLALAGCGKSDKADDDDARSGASGSSGRGAGGAAAGQGGSAGKVSSEPGGEAGAGNDGHGGAGTAGTAGSGGTTGGNGGRAGAPSGGHGGQRAGAGGRPSAGSAGMGEGGEPPEGAVDPVPAPDASWTLPTADPLNSTPPVLAPLGDAVVIAGGTSDPKLAGVDAFDAGIDSEAFVAALDRSGKPIWSTPLPGAGLPQAIAVDPSGDIVVVAAYLPDATFVSTGFYGPETLIAKLSPTGTLEYAKHVEFESGDLSLAIDADGSIYLGGAEIVPDGADTANVTVARFDTDAQLTWLKRFAHTGSTAYADAIALAKNGDVVITGQFNGSVSFGGDTLTTQAMLGSSQMQNGFIARFTKDGDHVRSERFGGKIFDEGAVLTALSSGDLLLAGMLSGTATLGGKSVSASEMGSAFLARIGDDDQASWVALAGEGYVWTVAVDPDEGMFHVAGDLGADRWLTEFHADGSQVFAAGRPANDLFFTTSMTVDSGLGLWLSGGFMGTADFGGGTVLTSSDAGVFLVRLERTGAP
jgi:hypothetical protein